MAEDARLTGRPMRLPPGAVDPLFEHELALELHMSVAELRHGRGTPMSVQELTVGWPMFFAYRNRVAQQQAQDERRRV